MALAALSWGPDVSAILGSPPQCGLSQHLYLDGKNSKAHRRCTSRGEAARPGAITSAAGPNPSIGENPMSRLTLNLGATALVSKPDNRDWTRETWRAAYSMARRMI